MQKREVDPLLWVDGSGIEPLLYLNLHINKLESPVELVY